MQPIAHFFLSILAGYCVGLHLESRARKLGLITILAVITCAIDLDHLLPQYRESGRELFHCFFVFIMLPAALFLLFFLLERKRNTTVGQRSSLVLSVMFVGAMLTDGMSGSKMALFYPMRSESYVFIDLGVKLDPVLFSLSSQQVFFIIWGALILFANLLETLTYKGNEGRTQPSFPVRTRETKTRSKSRIAGILGGMAVIAANGQRKKGGKEMIVSKKTL